MQFSRRQFLGFAAAGLAGWPHRALAEPFLDNTGLGRGQFVWEGWKVREGPVVVVVSRSAQIAHVYRGGVEIGISSCTTGRPGQRTPTGVFLVASKAREERAGGALQLKWHGTALYASNLAGYAPASACVRLPPEFAGLLFAVADHDAVVVIADEHTYPAEVTHAGILSARRRPMQARAEGPSSSDHGAVTIDAPPAPSTVAVVVSVHDKTAYILRDGAVEAAVPVNVEPPASRLGTHVYTRFGDSPNGGPSRWLAFGIGERRTDPHIAGWIGNSVLERVSIASGGRRLAGPENAGPATAMVITDEPAPPSGRRTPPGFVLLASDTAREPEVQRTPARTKAPARIARRPRLTPESLLRDY